MNFIKKQNIEKNYLKFCIKIITEKIEIPENYLLIEQEKR
jgi:tRNA splicing ligase